MTCTQRRSPLWLTLFLTGLMEQSLLMDRFVFCYHCLSLFLTTYLKIRSKILLKVTDQYSNCTFKYYPILLRRGRVKPSQWKEYDQIPSSGASFQTLSSRYSGSSNIKKNAKTPYQKGQIKYSWKEHGSVIWGNCGRPTNKLTDGREGL